MSPFSLYNGYMDFPLLCPNCQGINMVNLERPEKRNLTKLTWEYGFICRCGTWITLLVSNKLADDEIRNLQKRKIDKNYRYHFSKLLRRMVKLRG